MTMLLNVTGGLPIAGDIVGFGAELSWPPQCGRVTCCESKARS
jgi:hypothetical protein